MPYRRRRTYKRIYKRKRSGTNWNNVARTATKALSLASWIAGVINPELKHLDTTINSVISDSGTILHLTPVAQGDGDTDRNGDSVKSALVGLHGSWALGSNTGSTGATGTVAPQYDVVRTIIFVDTMDNQSTPPTVQDVLETPSPYSPKEIDARPGNRYHVLYDKSKTLNNTGGSTSTVRFTTKWMKHVHWSGTGGNTSMNGHIYCLFITKYGQSVFDGYARFRYYDN